MSPILIMEGGKIEVSDFGQAIELVEGAALVTSYNNSYYAIHRAQPELSDMVIARKIDSDLFEVMAFNAKYALHPTGEERNGKPVMRYEGGIYLHDSIEEGFSSLSSAWDNAGL